MRLTGTIKGDAIAVYDNASLTCNYIMAESSSGKWADKVGESFYQASNQAKTACNGLSELADALIKTEDAIESFDIDGDVRQMSRLKAWVEKI